MENNISTKLRIIGGRSNIEDSDIFFQAARILDEHDDLMLKVLAAPQVKTLRDEWAMTAYLSRMHSLSECYTFADQAIAISKETEK